jgi:hypothetical protein
VVVEQKLGLCEVCRRVFVLQYEYNPQAVVDVLSEIHVLRWVRCPARGCGHVNPLLSPLYVWHVRVKSVVGPDPADRRVQPNTLRRVWNGAAHGRREGRKGSPFPVQ